MALVEFFDRLDATEPLIRLIIAAVVIAVSLLMFITVRIMVTRKIARMEETPDRHFRPMRWQSQDLISSEDMKKLWMTLWRWLGWGFTAILSITALTGLLMTSKWTTTLAARMYPGFPGGRSGRSGRNPGPDHRAEYFCNPNSNPEKCDRFGAEFHGPEQ